MAITDDALSAIMAGLTDDLHTVQMGRRRRGISRGVAWAEASGRLADGSWAELGVHHKPMEQLLQAGLLVHQPLSRGGRTEVKGEMSVSYRMAPAEVAAEVERQIRMWLIGLVSGVAT